MIIEELTLKNFLAIFGKQTIKFPVKNQSSITIIIAPNNAGKTSIIRALHFLFYGFDTIEREKKAVNFEKISKSTIHNTIETYVEAVVFNAGRRYRVKRTLKANKLTEENIQVDIFDKKLSMIEHKKREDMPYEDTIMMENILKQMVPKGLFDFFFFKGEELAEKLVDPDSRDVSIFEGLSEILYQDKWNNTVSTLKSAVKAFDTKFRKASGQSEEVIRLQHRKDEYTEGNDTLRAAQKNAKKEAENKRKEYESLDQQVINSIPERNNTVKEKLSQLKRLINKNQNQIDDLSDIIKKAVGGSGGVYYLNNAFSEAYEVLNKLQDDKLLPPDISESILCSILDDKLCLCGTHLVEGTPERKKIEKLRARALAESLSNELYTLYCTLKESNCRGYQAERNKIVTSIKENSLKLDKAIEELASSEDEYKMIEKDYDKHADVTYKNLKKRRDLALKEYHEVRDRFKGIERKLQENQYELQKINQQLRGIKSIPKHARKLQICAFFATKILTAVEKIHDDLQSSYWTFLQENVSKLYEEIVTDQSRAVIDKRTLLPVIERAGIRGLSLGGGQQQTLVLAYIMALSELRKKVNNQLRKYFSLKTVDDQCFFMDSVFAPMQPEYRFKVATALPGKMKQLVLLVAPQQWDTSVSKSLKGSIDAAYLFLIKTNKPIKGKDYFLDFYGTECKLVENVKNKIHSYTEILSLEV